MDILFTITKKNFKKYLLYESFRLLSYKEYPINAKKSSYDLAKNGFVYIGKKNDLVKCFFCNMIKSNWEKDDDVKKIHFTESPKCELIKHNIPARYIKNPQIGYIEFKESKYKNKKIQSRIELDDYICFTDFNASSVFFKLYDENNTDITEPYFCFLISMNDILIKFIEYNYKNYIYSIPYIFNTNTLNYKDKDVRMKTYDSILNIPAAIPFIEFVDAGFYYDQINDSMICSYCGFILNEWKMHKTPLIDHIYNSSDCIYLKLNYNNEFINRILEIKNSDLNHSSLFELSKYKKKSIIENTLLDLKFDEYDIQKAIRYCMNNDIDVNIINVINSLCDLLNLYISNDNLKIRELKQSLRYKNERLHDLYICKVCMVNKICIVNIPCNHFVLCSSCILALHICPMCNKEIKEIITCHNFL